MRSLRSFAALSLAILLGVGCTPRRSGGGGGGGTGDDDDCADDDYEDNDELSDAEDAPGASEWLSLCPDDPDWYVYSLPPGDNATVLVEIEDGGSTVWLDVTNEDEEGGFFGGGEPPGFELTISGYAGGTFAKVSAPPDSAETIAYRIDLVPW